MKLPFRHDHTCARPVLVLHICHACNKEMEVTGSKMIDSYTFTFCNCPHCGKRNDIWIRLIIGDEPTPR